MNEHHSLDEPIFQADGLVSHIEQQHLLRIRHLEQLLQQQQQQQQQQQPSTSSSTSSCAATSSSSATPPGRVSESSDSGVESSESPVETAPPALVFDSVESLRARVQGNHNSFSSALHGFVW